MAGVLEGALGELFGENVKITGAGRTDAGVHASGQVVSLTTDSSFPFERLTIALRGRLPPDLSVREAARVDDAFSARFSARERTYVYAIFNRSQRSALYARYAYHVGGELDLGVMRRAGAHLVGEHDFRSFAAAGPEDRTVRRISRVAIDRRGDLLRIEVRADGFLHHMVRAIVGTLVECASGRRAADELPSIIAARDRGAAGPNAPGHGLYLAGVRYACGYDSYAEPPITRD